VFIPTSITRQSLWVLRTPECTAGPPLSSFRLSASCLLRAAATAANANRFLLLRSNRTHCSTFGNAWQRVAAAPAASLRLAGASHSACDSSQPCGPPFGGRCASACSSLCCSSHALTPTLSATTGVVWSTLPSRCPLPCPSRARAASPPALARQTTWPALAALRSLLAQPLCTRAFRRCSRSAAPAPRLSTGLLFGSRPQARWARSLAARPNCPPLSAASAPAAGSVTPQRWGCRFHRLKRASLFTTLRLRPAEA
jgi:hypothetical protein